VPPVLDTTHTTLDTRRVHWIPALPIEDSRLRLSFVAIAATLLGHARFSPFFARSSLVKCSTSTCSVLLPLCSTVLYSTLLYNHHYSPPVQTLLITTLLVRTDVTTSSPTSPAHPPVARPSPPFLLHARQTHYSSARSPPTLPLARDSYHVALSPPTPSTLLAAHQTSKPALSLCLVCLRSA
jgi:hypothetical protein